MVSWFFVGALQISSSSTAAVLASSNGSLTARHSRPGVLYCLTKAVVGALGESDGTEQGCQLAPARGVATRVCAGRVPVGRARSGCARRHIAHRRPAHRDRTAWSRAIGRCASCTADRCQCEVLRPPLCGSHRPQCRGRGSGRFRRPRCGGTAPCSGSPVRMPFSGSETACRALPYRIRFLRFSRLPSRVLGLSGRRSASNTSVAVTVLPAAAQGMRGRTGSPRRAGPPCRSERGCCGSGRRRPGFDDTCGSRDRWAATDDREGARRGG